MIAIVDYGAGNLVSVKKAFDYIGQECAITSEPSIVARAEKIVLPGLVPGHDGARADLIVSNSQSLSFRDAPLGAGPESITTKFAWGDV